MSVAVCKGGPELPQNNFEYNRICCRKASFLHIVAEVNVQPDDLLTY